MGKDKRTRQTNEPTPDNIRRYIRILEKIATGKIPSDEDLLFFADMQPSFEGDEQLAELFNQSNIITDKGAYDLALQKITELSLRSPETKEKFLNKIEELQKAKTGQRIVDALNTVVSLADVGTSVNQISEANKAISRSVRPRRPAPLTADPLLQQSIADAQQGTFDSARRIAPAQLALLDNYLADLAQAKTAATGQAGVEAALGQVASMRRGKGSLELAQISDDIRAREQARLDNLLQLKLQENRAINESQSQFYPTDLWNYQQEQQRIGELGAIGRENLRQSFINLGQNVVSPLTDFATRRRMDRLRRNTALADYKFSNDTTAADIANEMDKDELTRELYRLYYDPRIGT